MASTYSSFALVGASGHIGKHILEAFISNKTQVVVLTRASSGKTFPPSVTVVHVQAYDDVKAVTEALQHHQVDVLVSALSIQALDLQIPLAEAAMAAGVKLFVPSEYKLQGAQNPYLEHCKSLGLPVPRLHAGIFASLLPFLAGYHLDGKFSIIGDRSVPFSVTVESDIVGFFVCILTNLAPSKLNDTIFRIEGDRITFADATKCYNAELVDISTSGDSGEVNDFIKYVLQRIADGTSLAQYDAEAKKMVEKSDDLWAGHEWKKARDVFQV